jgi:hypothetical protein
MAPSLLTMMSFGLESFLPSQEHRAPAPARHDDPVFEIERETVGFRRRHHDGFQAFARSPFPYRVADDVGEIKLLRAVVPYGTLTEDDVARDDVERRIFADDALAFRRQHVDFYFQVVKRSVHK